MGYYDKGRYSGGMNPDTERQSARDRYLELLSRQRVAEQAMVDKMRHEQEALQRVDATNTNAPMLKGGQLGLMAGGPVGAIIGGAVGRAAGGLKSYNYRRAHGEGQGEAAFNAFLNPVQELENLGNTLTGVGSGGGQDALGGLATSAGSLVDAKKKERLANQLEAQKQLTRGGSPTAPQSNYSGGALSRTFTDSIPEGVDSDDRSRFYSQTDEEPYWK